MRSQRRCSKNGCSQPAVATLTYVYAESTAVIGPLAVSHEPHTYDLCDGHAERLTAPKGWDLVRAEGDWAAPPPSSDDLAALADAVREAARPAAPNPSEGSPPAGRRGHLRALPNPR
ncbi:DUF3499 domain-containing protein [Cryptosporangium phraense]|uniref:DUF3499 domain-containing protein n=1 Tax=Cryptosporangium phraense TaxID=2593070 RepID=A0A545AYP9_9ACTN|nr:DUF3499 domain-containing protein [Cryptosporangium phraense]TQS46460.1 DUF3499 domain-containing protein [Cryptosporangium phraense]